MIVITQLVKPEQLESTIMAEKDAGRRILALSPARFKRITKGWNVKEVILEVIEYMLVTQ